MRQAQPSGAETSHSEPSKSSQGTDQDNTKDGLARVLVGFEVGLGHVWGDFVLRGVTCDNVWVHFGLCLGSLRAMFGVTCVMFRVILAMSAVTLGHVWIIFGTCLGPPGVKFWPVWGRV